MQKQMGNTSRELKNSKLKIKKKCKNKPTKNNPTVLRSSVD